MTGTGAAAGSKVDLNKIQTDFSGSPGTVVVAGDLPGCYVQPGNGGGRHYSPTDSRNPGVTGLNLTPEQVEYLGLHSGAKYLILVQPVSVDGQNPTDSQ